MKDNSESRLQNFFLSWNFFTQSASLKIVPPPYNHLRIHDQHHQIANEVNVRGRFSSISTHTIKSSILLFDVNYFRRKRNFEISLRALCQKIWKNKLSIEKKAMQQLFTDLACQKPKHSFCGVLRKIIGVDSAIDFAHHPFHPRKKNTWTAVTWTLMHFSLT